MRNCEAGALQLLLCAALYCAANAEHDGRPRFYAGIPFGYSTAALVAPSHVPTTHLRLRGGSVSDAAGLDARLKALINQAPVMLFMKGEPDAPQCGFSRCVVQDADASNVPYSLPALTAKLPLCTRAGRSWRCCASTASRLSTLTFSKMKRCDRA